MKQRGIIAAALAAILLAGAAITVTAQPGPQGPRMGMGRGPGGPGLMAGRGFGLPGLRQLDLTDAQKEQIRNIHQSHREGAQQVAERTRTAQRELNLAADGPTVDEAAIRAKADALAAAIADGTIHRAKVNAEIFNVLTSEQQEKLKAFRAEAQERMKNRAAERRQRRQGR
jgi:Spy/CpxP family protein refolding chaperone